MVNDEIRRSDSVRIIRGASQYTKIPIFSLVIEADSIT